jgi:hypothetical protein
MKEVKKKGVGEKPQDPKEIDRLFLGGLSLEQVVCRCGRRVPRHQTLSEREGDEVRDVGDEPIL